MPKQSISASKNICFFGSYAADYARNVVLEDGLKKNKVKIYHCQASDFFINRYLSLTGQFLSQRKEFKNVLVGFPGHFDLPLAFILGKIFNKKIIFDIFASKYETYVLDRKYYAKNDIRAIVYYLLDWIDLQLADLVLIDTKTHLNFYRHLYGINAKKFLTVYVGAEEKIYYPQKLKKNTDVFFYGSYQPLQGVKYIVEAAKNLKNVSFLMVGNGQTRIDAENFVRQNKLRNIQFKDWVSGQELAKLMNESRILLGIFDNGQKALSVIPNKVYGGLACGKAVITGDTPAAREILTDQKNCLLVTPANEDSIADAITKLLKKRKFSNVIAKLGYDLFNKKLNSRFIVKELIANL